MNELALFAGAGGGLLGSRLLGWRTVAAVEIGFEQRATLMRRQEEGHLDLFPIWDDARTFDGKPFRGRVDIVTGGFPCQPYSKSGAMRKEQDQRNLWPTTQRIIQDVAPRYVLLENVAELLAWDYFGEVLKGLAICGYLVQYAVIPASAVGANHKRARVWIAGIASYALGERLEGHGSFRHPRQTTEDGYTASRPWWECEPRLQRVDDGVANRMDRLVSVGNGQVPGVVRAAWQLLGWPPSE